jgi:hypothetical protein
MKKPKRITKLTVETERTFVFRSRGGAPLAAWCAECGAEVEVATVDDAARAAGVSEMAIYRLVEAGALHFNEDACGRVLVCLNSVPKSRN